MILWIIVHVLFFIFEELVLLKVPFTGLGLGHVTGHRPWWLFDCLTKCWCHSLAWLRSIGGFSILYLVLFLHQILVRQIAGKGPLRIVFRHGWRCFLGIIKYRARVFEEILFQIFILVDLLFNYTKFLRLCRCTVILEYIESEIDSWWIKFLNSLVVLRPIVVALRSHPTLCLILSVIVFLYQTIMIQRFHAIWNFVRRHPTILPFSRIPGKIWYLEQCFGGSRPISGVLAK